MYLGEISDLEKKANDLRKQILDMCVRAGTGHVTSSFSCAEIFTALYYGGILRYDVSNPEWPERDRFILSKGHASAILYPVLADLGFYSQSELDKFCQVGGIFGVHLQNDIPGVETSSGSLGHGIGIAAGLALAAKMDKKKYMVFTLLGDGECYEGSVWESAMFASHHKLNNLIAIVDRNRLCATDFTEKCVRLDPLDKKWEACGWEAVTIDGHSIDELLSALDGFRSRQQEKPLVIIANTIKGKGVSFMENKPLWHAVAPSGKEAEMAKSELTRRSGE